MNIHDKQRQWESRTMNEYQREIDEGYLLEIESDRLADLLEDECIGDVRKRLDAIGRKADGAIAELNSAINFIAVALVRYESSGGFGER